MIWAAAVGAGVALLAGVARAEPGGIVRTVPAGLAALRVEAGSAAVVVAADPGLARTRIEVVPERWSPRCTASFEGDGQEARVVIRHEGERAVLGCRSRIHITLGGAGETALALDIRAAEVTLADPVAGRLEVVMDIGGVEGVVGAAGAELRASQAQVRLWEVQGPVHAEVQIGTVDIRYGQPLRAETRIYSEVGVIRVALPAPVPVRAQPGAGGYHNSLPPLPADLEGIGEGALDLRTRLGSIQVTPTSPPPAPL